MATCAQAPRVDGQRFQPTPMHRKDQIIDSYGPQLGELVWHSLHVDNRIAGMSEQHAASILAVVEQCQLKPKVRPIRILEIGAYAHFGAHQAAAALGGISVTHDISPTSLRVGLKGAKDAGIHPEATLVAGDFHDLPFETGYFDVVFCASSIHHTFRPWRVLKEALRSLRPGGVLQLENEPIGRALSFYGFRSNRRERFTPFEAELARRGSLFTFASPFPGSRPEILFGMIENDRIPLDLVVDTLSGEGRVASLQLRPQRGEFERLILDLPRDSDLEGSLANFLLAEVLAVRPLLTKRDRLLGAKLPGADEVWRLSYQTAPRLRQLPDLDSPERENHIANLFGAALRATVIKHGDGVPAVEMFRRPLPKESQVYNDLPTLPGLRLLLTEQPIPAIESSDLAALREVYPANDWEPCQEQNGICSMLNLQPRSRIVLPQLHNSAMLLLRFYAVQAAEPYRASLLLPSGNELSSVLVAQSESFLLRELVPQNCATLSIEVKTLEGHPLDLPRHIRLSVGRLIPIGP